MKVVLILMLYLLSIITFIPASYATSFSDIKHGSVLEQMVEYLAEKNIISGYPDNSFQPERTINRAEALKIIFETVQTGLEENTDSGFPDVDRGHWYAKYVTSGKKRGIISGYADGKFRPEQEVNRAEFIKMAMSALPFFHRIPQNKADVIKQFSDVYDELWYTSYVSAALEMGFLKRKRNLKPTAPMQRQDAVTIIYAISKYIDNNPLSIDESTQYIPEEAFTVFDPTIDTSSHIYDFDSNKLVVKYDINKTEIYNKYHGYNISLDETVRASGNSQNYDDTLRINFKNGCIVNIIKYTEYSSAKQYFNEKLDNMKNEALSAKSSTLVKIREGEGFTVYQSITEWDYDQETIGIMMLDQPSLSTFVITDNNIIYDFNSHGPNLKRSNCSQKEEKILNSFELR